METDVTYLACKVSANLVKLAFPGKRHGQLSQQPIGLVYLRISSDHVSCYMVVQRSALSPRGGHFHEH